MKKLLITLLLISPFSFADWGDVYYCQMTSFVGVTPEGKEADYILEKFQFKLNKTKNAMVYGKGGYFTKSVMVLKQGHSFPKREKWYANDVYAMLYFNNGKFLHVSTGSSGSKSISADCDKLE